MSHITTVELELNNVESLRKACTDCNVELDVHKKRFDAFRKGMPCDMAIVGPEQNMYQVGVKRTEKGMQLLCDNFVNGNGMTNLVGVDCGKLRQRYAYHQAMNAAQVNGYTVVGEQQMADGSIQLTMQQAGQW
jgi:hypothetical protein